MRLCLLVLALTVAMSAARAQSPGNKGPGSNDAPPRSSQGDNDDANSSSSRDTQIDITPPKNDVKDHPNSAMPELTQPASSGDVNELHPYNPYRADNDIQVGEYYLKLKDYKGALARFQDALEYKPNDAMANLRMAECYEKMNDPGQAAVHYREYLRILPNGPESKKAHKALEKLPAALPTTAQQ